MNEKIYTRLAQVLCYPAGQTSEQSIELAEELAQLGPRYLELLNPFVTYLKSENRETLEEAYINTFDIQAVCPLEVGYALFGEDYKRGEFLVRMSDMHKEYQTALVNSELGDFLPNIFLLLARMPENELKKDFIEKLLLPALTKMLKNFNEARGVNPYSLPLKVASELLLAQYQMNPKILEAHYE